MGGNVTNVDSNAVLSCTQCACWLRELCEEFLKSNLNIVKCGLPHVKRYQLNSCGWLHTGNTGSSFSKAKFSI